MKNEPIALPPSIKGTVNAQSSHEQLDFSKILKTYSDSHKRKKDQRSISVKTRFYGSLSAIPETCWMDLSLKGHQHCYGYDGADISHINQYKQSFHVRPNAQSHRDLSTGGNYGD